MTNEAERFGVAIVPAAPDALSGAEYYWRVSSVFVPAGAMNAGKHNIYVDAYGLDGKPLRNIEARVLPQFGSEQPYTLKLDKPVTEPGTNVPMFSQQTYAVEMAGYPSERVTGMHTRHPDEGPGNTWGHWSFHMVFDLTPVPSGATPPPEPEPEPPTPTEPPPPGTGSVEAGALGVVLADIDKLRQMHVAILSYLKGMESEINTILAHPS